MAEYQGPVYIRFNRNEVPVLFNRDHSPVIGNRINYGMSVDQIILSALEALKLWMKNQTNTYREEIL